MPNPFSASNLNSNGSSRSAGKMSSYAKAMMAWLINLATPGISTVTKDRIVRAVRAFKMPQSCERMPDLYFS
jgi:hypothetical protein